MTPRRRMIAAWVAMVSLAGCRSPAPTAPATPDPEVRRLAAAARRVWELGDPSKAVPLYREALARARSLDDAPAIAATAGSLAVCLYDLGDAAAAAPYVQEALVAAERAALNRGDLMVLDGRVCLALGDPDGAERAALQALRGRAGVESRVAARLLLAQTALTRTNRSAAAVALGEARRTLPPSPSAPLEAWFFETEAALRTLEGNPRAAARAWLNAAGARGRAAQPTRVARALLAAMRAFEQAGERSEAADSAVRAARALLSIRPEEAHALLGHAEELLADHEAPALRELIRALHRELSERTGGP